MNAGLARRAIHATVLTGFFAISGSIVRPVRVCAGLEWTREAIENVGLVVMGAAPLRRPSAAAWPLLRGKSRAMRRSRRPLRTSAARRVRWHAGSPAAAARLCLLSRPEFCSWLVIGRFVEPNRDARGGMVSNFVGAGRYPIPASSAPGSLDREEYLD